jgi:hypothetical protein
MQTRKNVGMMRWLAAAALGAGVAGFYAVDGHATPVLIAWTNGAQGSGCPTYYGGARGYDTTAALRCIVESSGSTAGSLCISNASMSFYALSVDTYGSTGFAIAQAQGGGDCGGSTSGWNTFLSHSCTTSTSQPGYSSCPSVNVTAEAYGRP